MFRSKFDTNLVSISQTIWEYCFIKTNYCKIKTWVSMHFLLILLLYDKNAIGRRLSQSLRLKHDHVL